MRKISTKKAFVIVYIEFLVSAASVWMVLSAFDAEGNLSPLGYAGGILFWLGLFGGIISYAVFFRKRFKGPNVLRFFSNNAAITADVTAIVSLAAVILFANQTDVNQFAALLSTFLLQVGIYSHFLLNGKIFTEILIENKKQKGRE